MSSGARYAALAAFGAVFISLLDAFHTGTGTTRWTGAILFGASWCTPLVYGLTTGVGGPVYARGYAALGGREPPPTWSRLVIGFAIFAILYALSGLYHGPNGVKLLVLGTAAVGLHAWLDGSRAGAVMALVTAVTGPLVEIAFIRMNVIEHLQPDFLGIPVWLPGLYACSAPVLGQGSRRWLSS